MAVFKTREELDQVMLSLWDAIKADKQMAPQLLQSRISISFYYRQPESRLTIDCSSGEQMIVIVGDTNFKPTVEMYMKSDLAHDFWLGKVNIPLALISGKIVAKGPVNKALALLPVIKPAFNIYPSIYQSKISKENI